jgi:hypothetical protein
MRRLLKRPKELDIRFCDRCARVCDSERRSTAIREEAQERALRTGMRLV